jgi:hypothetical protein
VTPKGPALYEKDNVMFRSVFAALLLVAGAGSALAQSRDQIQQLLAYFDQVDVNGDGAISRAEYRNVQLAQWPQIDRNADGFLALDDFPRMAAGRARTQLAEISYVDIDGDGRISQREFVDGEPPLFRRADRDGDGALTRSEIEAAANRR